MDKNLNDDQLKLVRFKILFIKRDYEHAFPEQEELVYDNLDGAAFTAWKIAEFIQSLGRKEVPIPRRWTNESPGDRYPGKQSQHVSGDRLIGLPEHDKKHLRVYYQVLERYPRERFRYEETQVDTLREIRDRIAGSEQSSGDPQRPGWNLEL